MQLVYREYSMHTGAIIRRRYNTMDECPAYRASSGGTAGDDTWSGTDDSDAYEKMLKHSQA